MLKRAHQSAAARLRVVVTLTLSICSLCLALSVGGCRKEAPLAEDEIQAIQAASDAYLAYERGDCEAVYRLTDPSQLAGWESTELRHSLTLANAFCREIDGDKALALEIYRQLAEDAPRSFAAEDARERIRMIELLERDAEYASWVEEVVAEAGPTDSTRTPVSRVPAEFPPAARAAGIEGFTIVEFGVTATGETEKPVIVASNPPFLFDGASIRAVRQWQYMRKPGSDEESRHVIRILFQSSQEPIEDAASMLVQ